jgi:hypothetical protein
MTMIDWLISFLAAVCLVAMVVLGIRELVPFILPMLR